MIIKGVDVRLPEDEEPLSPALLELRSDFMHACMNAFHDMDKPAFLEMPQGTDRRASLLCTALAWIEQGLKKQETTKCKILYLCETNDGAENILEELQRRITPKIYDFDLIVLNSKNISVFDSEMLNKKCICISTHQFFLENIISKMDTCLKDTLVIVDDAHLIDETSRKAASAVLSSCVVQTLLKDLENVSKDGSDLANLGLNLKILKKFFSLKPCKVNYGYPHYSCKELQDFFFQIRNLPLSPDHLISMKTLTNVDISNVLKFILHIFQFTDDEVVSMVAYCTEEYSVGQHTENCKDCMTIKISCLDASILLKRVFKCGASIVFTSATISPVLGLKKELGIESSNDFVGKSYIEDFQVYCRIVTCGAGGYYLDSSYSSRYDDDYILSLGKTILEVAKLTPQGEGLCIHFISKTLLDTCICKWQYADSSKGKSLWDDICIHKDIIVLPKKNQTDKEEFDVEKGVCILTPIQVCEDQVPIESRRVMVIVGPPVMYAEDPELRLKKRYIKQKDERSDIGSDSEYEEWQAYKLINTVIDRHICSTSQHGVILLCDTHYNVSALSPWIQQKIQRERRFSELLFELKDFFFHVKERMSSIMEENLQSSQFGGNVKSWEIEKSRLEYLKLKRQNYWYAGKKNVLEDMLKEYLEANESLKAELKKLQIQAAAIKSPCKREFSSVDCNGSSDGSPAKVRQQDSLDKGTEFGKGKSIPGSSLVSPLKETLGKLGIQSPGKAVPAMRATSPAKSVEVKSELGQVIKSSISPRKRSHPD